MKVIPWTVNDSGDIKLVLKAGVDGIISDYPNRVIEIVKEFKK
jgi:glycerophosphoryl diester phosphodiesterase